MKKNIFLSLLTFAASFTFAAETSWTDIDYVGDGHIGHKMDIHLPENAKGNSKVIVLIYGSAWFSNKDKAEAYKIYGKPLMDAGFAVATINHRASGDAKFPAQINDVKAAIRFLRANAKKYNLDTSFVGITGFSSGGHLSALAGATNGVREKSSGDVKVSIEGDLGKYKNYSSKVDAVVDWFGPIDMSRMQNCETYKEGFSPEAALVGGPSAEHPDMCKLLSPLTYLDKSDPKFLVIHGDDDDVVPICQSKFLVEELKKHGLLEDFIIVPKGKHGFITFNDNTMNRMVKFFKKQAAKAR